MNIDGKTIHKGNKKSWNFEVGETALGPVGVPVTVINGTAEGPIISITAGCHPMELNGIMTSIRLAREIDPHQLRGAVLIVHVQNVMGFQFKKGHISPLDGVGMGRAFPIEDREIEDSGEVSHQGKSLTYEIAERIFTQILLKSEYLIDLHGGELHESLVPNIEILPLGNGEIDEKIRSFAASFGLDLIWEVPKGSIPEMPTYPARGCAVLEAGMRGIPGVFFEVGGEGKIEQPLVELTLKGIENVMIHLGMIQGKRHTNKARVLIGGHVIFSQRGGLFITACTSGDTLSKGQTLGHIINLAGNVIETFNAPSDGILLNMITLGIANPGDMLYVIGNFSNEK